jgi:hypothetical protein
MEEAKGIAIHASSAAAQEIRQVCDYLNRLIRLYGANFTELDTRVDSVETSTATYGVEDMVVCNVSSGFDIVYDNAGNPVVV